LVITSYLSVQIQNLEGIQRRRKEIWLLYYDNFVSLPAIKGIGLPIIPNYATNNAHMFYLVCNSLEERSILINKLKENKILAVYHYLSLHSRDYYATNSDIRILPNCYKYANCLVRLPLYYELEYFDVNSICKLCKL
jgi:dTDP-4-amino-4,6-dideoxygalactose transaminase